MRLLIVALLIVLVSGCANYAWNHKYKTTEQFYQDNSSCMAMAGSGSTPQIAQGDSSFAKGYNQASAGVSANNKKVIHEQCMMGKGWFLVEQE